MIKTSPNNSPPKNISSKSLNFPLFWKRGLRSAKGLKTNARRSQILTSLWQVSGYGDVSTCFFGLLTAFCAQKGTRVSQNGMFRFVNTLLDILLFYLVSKRTKFSYYLSIICVRRLLGWWLFYCVVVVPLVLLAVVYIGLYICR